MTTYLDRATVVSLVSAAIEGRIILDVVYQHTTDMEVVRHRLAPFDIGSTNVTTARRYVDTLWAYSYTHVNNKTRKPDPRICSFDIRSFVTINETSDRFDEIETARLNQIKTGYDYRGCSFALLPKRDWFT